MDEYTITTNYHPRDIIDAWQLTAKERAEFDYLDWAAIEEGRDSASFIRYKGELYDLAEFEVWSNPSSPLAGSWHVFRSDTFFSGILVRYCEDNESVIVARYYA